MTDDIVREFLVESSENLDLLDRELINLEKDPGNRGTLASIFRTLHTIKGTCGFLGFTKLESVAHVGENLLSKLRDGELALTPEMTTALLAMVDAIRQMLASVEATGNEGERNDQELIQTLTRILQGSAGAAKAEGLTPPPAPAEVAPAELVVAPTAAVAASPVEVAVAAPPVVEAAPKTEGKPEHAEHSADHGPAPTIESGAQSQSRTAASESSIRVDVTLLDKLMNLVGELVLARNQILSFPTPLKMPASLRPASASISSPPNYKKAS
jgi:two-component system chemotaxis sensor kinase CheA